MIDKIYKLLKDIGYPVYCGWYNPDINETHITFWIYNTAPTSFSDGFHEELEDSIQFDVWGTNVDEVQSADKALRKILKENEIYWANTNKDFETDSKLYHYSIRFSLNYDEE